MLGEKVIRFQIAVLFLDCLLHCHLNFFAAPSGGEASHPTSAGL